MRSMGRVMQGRGRCRALDRVPGEEGFLLIGVLIAVFLILLVLSVAAPTVARQLRREREVETVHRGDQYVRAVQLYYRKFRHYPGSVEELEKSNNIRFLRQKYTDPMTGKADWRLIHVGEQKTTLKGFFGQPLAGIATSGLGSAASLQSPGGTGTPASSLSAFGSAGAGSGGGAGASGLAGTAGVASGTGGTGTSTAGGTDSSGLASQPASGFAGSGAPFVGVGSSAPGNSMIVLNEQTTYPTWEFVYDPRIEQMKANVNLLGGGMAGTGSTGLGSSLPGSSLPGTSSPGTTPSGGGAPGTQRPPQSSPTPQ